MNTTKKDIIVLNNSTGAMIAALGMDLSQNAWIWAILGGLCIFSLITTILSKEKKHE